MIEVKRFSPNLDSGVAFKGMDKDPNGKYVYFEDYDQIRQKLEAAEARESALRQQRDNYAECIVNLQDKNNKLEKAMREHQQQEFSDDEWQPIETAPKDGQCIDLLVNGYRVTDCKFLNGKWVKWNDGDQCYYWAGDPSHWMPIPAPPQSEVKPSC